MNTLTEPERHAKTVAYLPLVGALAAFTRTSLEYDDRYQEGYLGLRHAVEHFDERKSPAFGHYARKCIRGAILNGTRRACNEFGLGADQFWATGFIPRLSIEAMREDERERLLGMTPAPDRAPRSPDLRRELEAAMGTLTEREREILRLRFGWDGQDPALPRDLANRYGVCAERIRQIERGALAKLQRRVSPELLAYLA